MLIDGHASHITVEFIEYCWTYQIVPLCLPPHTTHYLQPLDVGCFGPLSLAYKRQLDRMNQMGIVHVNKADFLKFLRDARAEAMTLRVIQSAWASTGLILFNPDRVHMKLPRTLRESISPPPLARTPTSQCPPNFNATPSNKEEMMRCIDSLNPYSPNYRQKLRRVKRTACLGLADRSLLKDTSRMLFKANLAKEEAKRKRKEEGARATFGSGFGRVLTEEGARKLRAEKVQKQEEKEAKKSEAEAKAMKVEAARKARMELAVAKKQQADEVKAAKAATVALNKEKRLAATAKKEAELEAKKRKREADKVAREALPPSKRRRFNQASES